MDYFIVIEKHDAFAKSLVRVLKEYEPTPFSMIPIDKIEHARDAVNLYRAKRVYLGASRFNLSDCQELCDWLSDKGVQRIVFVDTKEHEELVGMMLNYSELYVKSNQFEFELYPQLGVMQS